MSHQNGGTELGRGKYGRTIDVYDVTEPTNSLFHLIESFDGDIFLHRLTGKRILKHSNRLKEFLKQNQSTLIVKEFETANSFTDELKINKIFSKLSNTEMRKFTTIAKVNIGPQQDDVVGIQTDKYYIFLNKCDVSMNNFIFTDQESIRLFITHILESFKKIHSSDVFHCDVKLDNMIYCNRTKRFKLIDWGKSCNKQHLVKRYINHIDRPSNTSSPMAWLAWGMGHYSSIIHMLYSFYRQLTNVLSCSIIGEHIFNSSKSFESYICNVISKTNEIPSNYTIHSKNIRKKLVNEYASSFDLFDFGYIVLHILCKHKDIIESDLQQVLRDLVYKVTLYGDSEFETNTAKVLRWWTRKK